MNNIYVGLGNLFSRLIVEWMQWYKILYSEQIIVKLDLNPHPFGFEGNYNAFAHLAKLLKQSNNQPNMFSLDPTTSLLVYSTSKVITTYNFFFFFFFLRQDSPWY